MKCKKNIIQEEIGRIIYQNDDGSYSVCYTDDININSKETVKIKDLGNKFSFISAFFYDYISAYNIPTGYIKLTDGSLIQQKHMRFSFFIKILNIIDKRTARIFNKTEGTLLALPVLSFHLGNTQDNMISETHLASLDLCPLEDLKIMKRICSKINAVLKSFFERRRNLSLAEVNCAFGKDEDKIFLVDDFTPASFKIVSNSPEYLTPNPYKLKSQDDYKKYTDFLLGLTNS